MDKIFDWVVDHPIIVVVAIVGYCVVFVTVGWPLA